MSADERDGFERITPQSLQPQQSTPAAAPAASGSNSLVIGLALTVVLLLLLIVFVLLPRVSDPAPASPAPATEKTESPSDTPDTDSQAQEDPTEWVDADAGSDDQPAVTVQDAETVLAQRKAATEAGAALQLRLRELGRRSVGDWGKEDWEALKTKAKTGQAQFDQRQYEAAAETWKDALPLADSLMDQLGWEYLGALQQGEQALEDGDRERAEEAFRRALAMNPDSKEARIGLQRAAVLEDVLALLQGAIDNERRDELDRALARLQKATAMDPAHRGVKEALARVEAAIEERDFRRSMTRAQTYLDEKRFEHARRSFNAAAKLRPGDPAVKEGLAAVAAGEQLAEIQRLSAQARQHEQAEAWSDAASRYQRIIALDNTLAFAHSGLKRAQERAEIDAALLGFIQNPDRLFEPKEKTAADALLRRARDVRDPGRRLREQVDWLERALALAREPVTVELVSDNATQVLLYKVGKLGRFDRQVMELLPGDYTVVGRCEGYRDERQQFSVRPGMNRVGPVDVRCRERI